MEKLLDQDIITYLKNLPGWKWDEGKWMSKRYRFQNYLTGVSFVNELANYSEHRNHHPFISIDYKVVTIKLSSWNAGGLTSLDMEMAKIFDEIYDQFVE
ncbi:4a-hydroxytetrahydrobiopterin dehydratase [Robertmurraya beringensis]|uniref:4a-hydroxytetrahydrobiopterin dehydratase n=1 Tax=Robertmurraya beringensis TaxID=641660 RepID=A0ABV6KWA8_9BACI